MLLATRCPFCETVFRIQPQQLAARHGLVRCGHCQESFDASGSLFDVSAGGDFSNAIPIPPAHAAELTSAAASAAASPSAARAAGTPVAGAKPIPAAQPVPSAPPAPPAASAPNPPNPPKPSWKEALSSDDEPAPGTSSEPPTLGGAYSTLSQARSRTQPPPQPSPSPGAAPRRQNAQAEPRLGPDQATAAAAAAAAATRISSAPRWSRVEPDPAEPTLYANQRRAAAGGGPAEPHLSGQPADPAFGDLPPRAGTPFAMTREAPARAPRRTGWRIAGVLAALLLLALLAAQIAWWLRETVMVSWPASMPIYQKACEKIGCHVLPPRDIDGLQVEPSDLRQVDDPHHLELKMPLRNRFGVPLAYPAIELTLLDRQNSPVLRRVLWPQDYVPPGTHIDAGLPAGTTQTMIVRLDTGNVVASNFRIEVFYP